MFNILSKLLTFDFFPQENYILIDSIECKKITTQEGTLNSYINIYIENNNVEDFKGYFVLEPKNDESNELFETEYHTNSVVQYRTESLQQFTIYQNSSSLLLRNIEDSLITISRDCPNSDYSNTAISEEFYFVSMKFDSMMTVEENKQRLNDNLLEVDTNCIMLIIFSSELIKLIHFVRKIINFKFSIISRSIDSTSNDEYQSSSGVAMLSTEITIHSKPKIDIYIPKITSPSILLNECLITDLSAYLPTKCVGYDVKLVYSSNTNGTSLRTLYREVSRYETDDFKNMPYLLLIQDQKNTVFGALLSDPIKINNNYYGTGESFVFSLKNEFKIYKWSSINNFIIYACNEYLSIGGGNGQTAIWIDESLDNGRSSCCETFNNDILSFDEDFHCSGVELWTFYEPLLNDFVSSTVKHSLIIE